MLARKLSSQIIDAVANAVVLVDQILYLAASVYDGAVIAPAKRFADFLKRVFG